MHIYVQNFESLIHVIRDKQIMLDRDLAALYGIVKSV